jgi:hypothetical protein
MTEEDVLWVPGIWEKEAEDRMIKRVGEGIEQCLRLSEGCTCEYLLSFAFITPFTVHLFTWPGAWSR